VRANKNAGGAAATWALDDFLAFIEVVIARLNSIGYSLRTPAKARLETLLDKNVPRGKCVQ